MEASRSTRNFRVRGYWGLLHLNYEEINGTFRSMTLRPLICETCGSIRDRKMTLEGLKAFPLGPKPSLNEAERQTIVLACNGMTNKEVASEMHTSEQVVKNRLRVIYAKTGTRHKGELITRMWKFIYEGI